jgi:formylglycine-generating enzyme required for sulfatase activity
MTIYHCQRNNRSIRLTEELAHSGEAKVWRTDFQGYLAKIYHDPHNERIEKLQVMVRHIPADPNAHLKHISFAWPYSILEDSQGEIVGFLMPEVVGSETLLKLCTPQLRRKLKLETNWYFLHVVARNVAGIIQAIHREGYVLGDIKLENILVNNRALPTIIDTDSFQVPDPHGNKIYRCLVGSEGFTPAELMGVDIASVNQTEVHDRFRLGVVIYYLLFGGPPFRGMWQGSGEPPEQSELIRRGLWPFSSDNLILPSQTTIPLEILHPRLQTLFLQCFNKGYYFPHKRPTAGDWLEALEVGFNELASCGKVDSHFYSLGYGHCYWCDRAKDFGVDIFPGNAITTPKPKPSPVTPPKPLSQPKIAQKVSSPKIVEPPSNQPVKLWPRRNVLVGLGWVTVGGLAGIKIFAQPRSSVTQKITPSPTVELTSFTEKFPNDVELEMVVLPAGKFLMGSPKSDPDAQDHEFPQHEVTVPSFAIGKYPVTQAQWQALMGNNPSYFQGGPRNPVERVSWYDCQEFCQKLSELTGKTYRLPSEAEWEYACRSGTTTRYSFGDGADKLGDYAWFGDNSGDSILDSTEIWKNDPENYQSRLKKNNNRTHPVGQKKTNPWGLYDMHGNVWERCEDGLHSNYNGAPTDGSAWTDNHSRANSRVLRGGSWVSNPEFCRSAHRNDDNRNGRYVNVGLRLVCVLGRT